MNVTFCADELMTVTSFGELTLKTPTSECLHFLTNRAPWICHACSAWFYDLQPLLYKRDVRDVPEKDSFLPGVVRVPGGQCLELDRALYRQGTWDTQTALPEPGPGFSDSRAGTSRLHPSLMAFFPSFFMMITVPKHNF